MTNKIESLYHELLEVVEKDGAACVVSKYHDDGSVIKELVSADDKDAWERLLELEKQPGVVVKGPVSSINALGAIGDAAVTAAPAASPAALTVVEHYTSKPRMIILGAGHIAAQLAPIAKQAEFDILLYDDRASFANRANFPDANEIICDGFSNLFSRVKLRNSDYVVIVTRGHKHDADCLRGILSGVEPA
jgi:xanthine dehydrogenase accessory factor